MKKLLGLTGLAAVLILSACGNGSSSDETVCTIDIGAQEIIFTLQPEDGEVTSIPVETKMDTSEFQEGMVDMITAELEEDDFKIDGDMLSIFETREISDLGVEHDRDLETIIEMLESMGAICE